MLYMLHYPTCSRLDTNLTPTLAQGVVALGLKLRLVYG